MKHTMAQKSMHFLIIVLALASVTNVSALFENPEGVAILNTLQEFQTVLITSDFLVGVLICSDEVETCRLIEPIYKEFADNMKDFVKSYAVVCDSTPEKLELPHCKPENIQHLPYLAYFEPPATVINPYTKQVSQPIEHRYAGDGDPKSLANYARQYLPAFRETISTKEKLDEFLNVEEIPNKVLLFTNKPQTSPLYKALASEYRKRLLFAEINESAKDLVAEYGITKYPTLLVVKRNQDGSYEREFYEYDLAIEKLRRFLKSFALAEKADYNPELKNAKQEEPKHTEAPKQEKAKSITINAQDFNTEVNKHERVVLVHAFTDSKFPIMDQIEERYGRFFEYLELDCNNAENEAFAKDTLHVKSFPSLVALPIGKTKKMTSKVIFSKTRTLQEINEEISELVGDKVISIAPNEMQGVISDSLVKRKPTFMMMYDTSEVSLVYRLFSQLSRYEGKLTFTKLKNPGPEVVKHFELTKLPALLSVLYDGEEEGDLDPQKVKIVKYSGRFNYDDMSKYFDMFLPRDEILEEMTINKQVNQISTNDDLVKHCPKDARVCVIGLLNGYKGTELAKTQLEEKLGVLNHVLKKFPHLSFAWIDGVCHSEVLISLNIQSEDVPTVIVYSPVLKEYAQLVGTFDNASISVFLDKVLKRKLPMYGVREGIVLENKNCEEVHEVLQKQEAGYGSADDDFMKEYLEELRKKEEEENAGKKKKKKKKKFDDDL